MESNQNKKSILSKFQSVWSLIRETGTAVQIISILGLAIGPAIAAGISSWAYIEGAPWPVFITIFITLTLVTIVFSHYLLYFIMPKFIDRQKIGKEDITTEIDDDWGILDYEAEGNRRIVKSTKMVQAVGKGMNKVRVRAKSATSAISFSLSPDKKLKKAALLANAIEEHIEVIDCSIIYFDESIPIIKICYHQDIARAEERKLKYLVQVMGSVHITSLGTADIIRNYATAYESIRGISKTINIAIDKAAPRIVEFTERVESFGEMCREIKVIAEQKLKA